MEVFPSTLQQDEPDLDRVSAFADWLQAQPRHRAAANHRPPGLSASAWQDLWCAPRPHGRWRDVVEVLAASLRHALPLTLYLGNGTHVVPLTLYPLQRLARCPLDDWRLEALNLAALRVLHVEPALLQAPEQSAAAAAGNLRHCRPLAPISWLLALHGPRRQVLPELAGGRACRRVPGLSLQTPGLGGAVAGALERLGHESASLRTIASWPGMDAVRAARLINGLYLQGALIVSRSHPAARER